jgi:hypothetical protein
VKAWRERWRTHLDPGRIGEELVERFEVVANGGRKGVDDVVLSASRELCDVKSSRTAKVSENWRFDEVKARTVDAPESNKSFLPKS